MFGWTVLEVIIGLGFFYWLLSLIASQINEWISQLFAMRSAMLEGALRNLLRDPKRTGGVTEAFLSQPLVQALFRKGWLDERLGREGKPSYIAPSTFALALLDTVAPPANATQPRIFAELANAIQSATVNDDLKKTLLTLVREANGDVEKARKNIEGWFDDAMERASGWYKRQVQLIIVAIAVVLAVVANADTLAVTHSLWNDSTLRDVIVTEAGRATSTEPPATPTSDPRSRLSALTLPIGWWNETGAPRPLPQDATAWLAKVAGLFVTTIAISLGAPFWFDLIGKLVNLRLTGQPPKKEETK